VIAIDTNVLARWFVEDDARQVAAARGLLADERRGESPILLTPLVLAELEWVLRSTFRRSKDDILEVLGILCEEPAVVIDDRSCVEIAIANWRDGRADFADYLIAALARDRGATAVLTFNRDAAKSAAFTLLTA
jgi:predicted nucleic-acid-binding protein